MSPRPRAATSLPEPDPPAALRVLWLSKGLGPGGAERLLVTHAAAADPERVSFQAAYLLPEKTHLVGELEHLGVRTHALEAPSPLDPRWLGRLRALVVPGRFDVVHAHSPAPAALARLALRAMSPADRPAFVSTEHNVWSSHTVVTRTANSATYGLNDAAIAVSEEVRASMSPRWRRGTRVIHHGIDIDAVRALRTERDRTRAELGVRADEVLAVTVANFRPPKGYPDLFEAARQVGGRGLPVRFVVVGQGPLADELARRHDELGLGARLQILGYRPDAPRLTAAADLFELASHHEGLPVSVMEAFAAGVPVVATDVGGLAEAVHDGRTGRLVPPRRPDLLAAAVAELAGDPDERRRLGRGAADDADRFSAARSELEVEDVYRAAVERAALRSPIGRGHRPP